MITELMPLEAIVQKAKAGDKDCLNLLLGRAYDYFQGHLAVKVHHHSDRDDILQEALISIAYRLHQLQDNGKFWHWASKIVHHEMLNHFKKRKRQMDIQSLMAEYSRCHARQIVMSPADQLIRNESLEEIHTHLDDLPTKSRDIFRMRHIEMLSYANISKHSNLSCQLARLRFHRAKKQLRLNILKQHTNESTYSLVS